MITRIFIDLDDVLGDFTCFCLGKMVGRDVGPEDYDPEWGWDIVKAYNHLKDDAAIVTAEEFWSNVPGSVWSSLPRARDCDFLLQWAATMVGRDSVAILSSPIRDPWCAAGKMSWIQRFLPKWIHRQFFIGSAKQLVAQPCSLLIDDSDINCENWNERGGISMLYPQPWNTAHERWGEPIDETICKTLVSAIDHANHRDRLHKTFR
jgi:hypothetical protein